MESLLDKKKADQLTLEEIAELDAISELDRIFTHMNAMLAAQYASMPINPEEDSIRETRRFWIKTGLHPP